MQQTICCTGEKPMRIWQKIPSTELSHAPFLNNNAVIGRQHSQTLQCLHEKKSRAPVLPWLIWMLCWQRVGMRAFTRHDFISKLCFWIVADTWPSPHHSESFSPYNSARRVASYSIAAQNQVSVRQSRQSTRCWWWQPLFGDEHVMPHVGNTEANTTLVIDKFLPPFKIIVAAQRAINVSYKER